MSIEYENELKKLRSDIDKKENNIKDLTNKNYDDLLKIKGIEGELKLYKENNKGKLSIDEEEYSKLKVY